MKGSPVQILQRATRNYGLNMPKIVKIAGIFFLLLKICPVNLHVSNKIKGLRNLFIEIIEKIELLPKYK